MKRLILILSLIPVLAYGQNSTQRFISVRGESEIDIVPDKIELTITFSETENIKKENELQQKEAELIKVLKDFSIDLNKLTIDNFVANRYEYYKYSSRKVRMSKVFKLELDNIAIADPLIITLLQTGANKVEVTNLQSDKLEETKLEAARIALDKATRKAGIMADHLNCFVGKVLEVSEFRPQIQTIMDNGGYFSQFKTVTAYGVNRVYDGEGEDVGIRKIRVVCIVDVKYELY